MCVRASILTLENSSLLYHKLEQNCGIIFCTETQQQKKSANERTNDEVRPRPAIERRKIEDAKVSPSAGVSLCRVGGIPSP